MKLSLIAVLFMAALVLPSFAQDNGATTGDAAVQESDLGGGGDVSNGSTTGDEPQDESQEDSPEQEVQEEQEEDEEEEDNEESQEDVKQEDIPTELKDEVENVKRGFPQIHPASCRILKRYGYCRNAGIVRFCMSTCRPCRNLLSLKSCNLLKSKYKQCLRPIGRVYCRKTCGHCGPKPLPSQCRTATLLSDVTRKQSYKGVTKCDNRLPERWYRFGAQGKDLPTKPTRPYYCGTHASGWLVGALPRIRGKTVTRQVCFSWSGKTCYNAKFWKIHIQITNCGRYNVYFLRRPKACHYRYCGNL